MNVKLEEFKKSIKGKKVAVLGIGISNMPLIIYLSKLGVDVTAFDKQPEKELSESVEKLKPYDIKFSLGENYLEALKGFDIIFKTPVIRFDIPELLRAKAEGSLITSEMEVFLDLCPARIFGVTGSDGKTTTTTLISLFLEEEGYTCWLGGNIGKPLLEDIDHIKDTDMVIVELSSFQLQTMKKSANIAVITNISPNHLDVHKSYDEYKDAKKNIYNYQTSSDLLILNYDNEETRILASEAKGKLMYFSRQNVLKEGVFVEGDYIVSVLNGSKTQILNKNDLAIPGEYNVENCMAAIAATLGYVSPDSVKKVIPTFRGVEHRCEVVATVNGVKFYNNSIASSPGRTAATLSAYDEKVILIAGGKDKGISYDSIGSVIHDKVKVLILIGATSDAIESAYRSYLKFNNITCAIPVIRCTTYQEAVETAFENASSGDNVILSPASTSFDLFKNFEERGNTFKRIVLELAKSYNT